MSAVNPGLPAPGDLATDTVVGTSPSAPATLAAYAIVADSELARALSYRETLEQLHLEAVVTRDGREAIEIMSRHGAPVVLVADVSLPQVDGLGVVRALRRLAPGNRAAAILMSTYDELRALASSLQSELAISDVLRHSISGPEFRSAIEAALRGLDATVRPAPEVRSQAGGVSPVADVETIIGAAVSECVDAFPELAVTAYVQIGDHRWFRSALRSVASLTALPPLASLVRRVFETGETLILADISTMAAWQERAGEYVTRGLIAVPIGPSRDRTVGVVYLSGPTPVQLPPFELDLLNGIARKAGQALRPHVAALARAPAAVRLTPEQFERLSREAMEDPLTGLTNRHGGEVAMQRELARAKREKRSLSLLLIDVDHFKQVNDTQGHAVGDRVLRSIARLATDCVRASDVVVRWGGEEFLVILPSVAVDGARDIAERIRARIEKADHEALGVTISAGASEVQSAEDLVVALARADALLHRAKAEGRNRVL